MRVSLQLPLFSALAAGTFPAALAGMLAPALLRTSLGALRGVQDECSKVSASAGSLLPAPGQTRARARKQPQVSDAAALTAAIMPRVAAKPSLWLRNVQLAFFSSLIAAVSLVKATLLSHSPAPA
ncbi:MAG: hypothetical protein VX181_20020, partial [Pseudomonadota bacterium]|nr:hypothetical protein [Pseudomonadota bacterium]